METIQHKLQQFDPGVVWLDKDNRISVHERFGHGDLQGTAG